MSKTITIIFCFIFCCITACSEDTLSPEDEIKQYIANGKMAAEERSHNELGNLIDEHYRDQKGLNKKQIIKMARGYFFTHKNIHLLTQVVSIDFQNKKRAFVVLYVAMAGNVIADLSTLTSIRAQVYRFDLQLIKDDKWLLQQAKWQTARVQDML